MTLEADSTDDLNHRYDHITPEGAKNEALPLPRLLDGETLVKITEYKEEKLIHPPSSIKAIEELALAGNYEQIGEFGPILASAAFPNREHEADFTRYHALFGRDSLRVALDLVDRYPKLTRITLVRLAELQGVSFDVSREEEPGRIIHEDRDPQTDLVAKNLTAEFGWGWPYYGSVDSTPEFVRTLLTYCRSADEGYGFLETNFMGRDQVSRTMASSLEAALNWIIERVNSNNEGLLEFRRVLPRGIENQVWKDSWDSYFHSDGTIANHESGIASVEVQRVSMDALYDTADYYKSVASKPEKAQQLKKVADNLRDQLLDRFWTDSSGGFFVLGTDRGQNGNTRQLAIKTSNMGHLLHSRLLASDERQIVKKREAVIRLLFSEKMLSYSGVRTLATDEARFRPGAYHNGSVWIWDNYLIAQGLDQQGYYGLARFLEAILIDDISSTSRFPEYLRGDTESAHRLNNRLVEVRDNVNSRINLIEQPPQDIQAWSAAAVLAIKYKRKNVLPFEATDDAKRAFEREVINNIPFYSEYLEKIKRKT
jgi:glycogen debranching enzyme